MSKKVLPDGSIEIRIDEGTQEENVVLISPKEIVKGSVDALRQILATKSYKYFVWASDDRPEYEPLLVDLQTANVMMKVYDSINEKNQTTFREQAADNRGYFGRLVDFCWSCVEFKRT